MQRVMVYVDGFNLYYGLRDRGWRRYFWLDLRGLSENLLRSGQRLVAVSYFTARVSSEAPNSDRQMRQNRYLEALATLPDLRIHYGYYQAKKRSCRQCGATWDTHEEKMTDVNIAVAMLGDAQDDAFDTAILVSGDGDLTGPVRAVRQRYPEKRVVVALPPKRSSFRLRGAATASFTIGRGVLSKSQFPNQVTNTTGYVVTRPQRWN